MFCSAKDERMRKRKEENWRNDDSSSSDKNVIRHVMNDCLWNEHHVALVDSGGDDVWTYGRVMEFLKGYSGMIPSGVRVGLCIPNGSVYLALSILLVHSVDSCMIPLDISTESKFRWQQMNELVRPQFYLTYGSHHTTLIYKWTTTTTTTNNNNNTNGNSNGIVIDLSQPPTTTTTTTTVVSEDENDKLLHHLCFTSGTSNGQPKCCMASRQSFWQYITTKNKIHTITNSSRILLASSLPFDPCLSDVLATFYAQATLILLPPKNNHHTTTTTTTTTLTDIISQHSITHVLTTPTIWSTTTTTNNNDWEKTLQVVALGGEFIPPSILPKPYLYSTYGVTEVCVYQTFGLYQPEKGPLGGQCVGYAFDGTDIYIQPSNDTTTDNHSITTTTTTQNIVVGQVVLSGKQLQKPVGYYKTLHHDSFLLAPQQQQQQQQYYTGDLGYIWQNKLYLLGRMKGSRQIKYLGIRIDCMDIENELYNPTLFQACRVISYPNPRNKEKVQLAAFFIPTSTLREELILSSSTNHNNSESSSSSSFLIVSREHVLQTYLQQICQLRVLQKCTPHHFIILLQQQFPMTRTGKCNDEELKSCLLQELEIKQNKNTSNEATTTTTTTLLLKEYGKTGNMVAHEISQLLHIPIHHITIHDHFQSTLGGDSLTAILAIRSFVASYRQIPNSRHIPMDHKTIPKFLQIQHFLNATTLQEYIHHLDDHWNTQQQQQQQQDIDPQIIQSKEEEDEDDSARVAILEGLKKAISMNQTLIACALLSILHIPQKKKEQPRLGKLSQKDAQQRRRHFTNTPLHLACMQGNYTILKKLCERVPQWITQPNASGTFPIHLLCSTTTTSCTANNCDPLKCLQYLLKEQKQPITIRDASKQTLLHAAARGGQSILLQYLLEPKNNNGGLHMINAHDRWFRTPLHWCIYNQHKSCVKLLLSYKECLVNPPKPSANVAKRFTSGNIETPLEVATRIYQEQQQKEGDTTTAHDIFQLVKYHNEQ